MLTNDNNLQTDRNLISSSYESYDIDQNYRSSEIQYEEINQMFESSSTIYEPKIRFLSNQQADKGERHRGKLLRLHL